MTVLTLRASGPIRRRVRSVVPFVIRSGVVRVPHVLDWIRRGETYERGAPAAHVVAERSSPLRRPNTTYEPALQSAKESNVARVARALDGVCVPPGGTLSWHGVIGPPLRIRGFRSGPELHDGLLARGPGGGACQVANLLFWLGAHAGLTLLERHRHGLDLFPDHQRHVPFGCGATVFYPHRDLRFRNPHSVTVRLGFQVRGGMLRGQITTEAPLPARWELVERDHRFFRRHGATWRANTIVRRQIDGASITEGLLVENLARVTYPVSPELLEP